MNAIKLPTVDELNAAQAEWMALDSNGPKAEINRVIKLYEATNPLSHLSVSPDRTLAAPMIGGMPIWAAKQPIANAMKWAVEYNTGASAKQKIRLDVAWCGSTGKWVAL